MIGESIFFEIAAIVCLATLLAIEPLPVVKTEIRAVYGALSGRLFWFLAV